MKRKGLTEKVLFFSFSTTDFALFFKSCVIQLILSEEELDEVVLYADVLICINIIIDYFLLNITAALLGCKCSFLRLILGSVVGGICSLTILVGSENIIIAFLIRIFSSTAVILSAFGFSGVGLFLRRAAVFFTASFLFSGCMTAITELLTPKGLLVKNGIVYYDLSAVALVVFSAVVYLTLSLILRFSKRKSERTCKLSVYDGNTEIHITALIDSGNRLHEPFSEKWVVLLDSKYENIIKGEGKARRIIPFSTVSGEGILNGFIPDKVILEDSGEQLDVYVAFSVAPLQKGYGAIISSDAI